MRADLPYLTALLAAAWIFYLVPWAPVYVVALLAVAFLTWRRLDLALVLVVLFCPFVMLPKHFGNEQFAPAEVFLLLDLVVAVLYFLDEHRRPLLRFQRLTSSPFLLPGLLFLLAATISTLFAVDRHDALRAYRETIVEPALFFALLAFFATRFYHWRLLFWALLGAGVVVGSVAAFQLATGHGLSVTPGTSIRRVPSVYGSADNVGLLYDRVLPVWLALVLAVTTGRWVAAWRRARPKDEKRPGVSDRLVASTRHLLSTLGWPGWLLAAVGALLLITLVVSYSRGAWLAIAVAALAMLLVAYSWGRWMALACVIFGLAALGVKGPEIVHALQAGHSSTVQRRIDLWRSSLKMIENHPILGIGPDNFIHYYAPTRAEDLYQKECAPGLGYMQPGEGAEPCLSHPHNEILDFWLSTGVLGLIAFIWLQVVFWRAAIRLWIRRIRPGRALLLGSMGAMLAALIHGFVDNSYFLMDLALIFWLLCGYVSFLVYGEKQDEPRAHLNTAQEVG